MDDESDIDFSRVIENTGDTIAGLINAGRDAYGTITGAANGNVQTVTTQNTPGTNYAGFVGIAVVGFGLWYILSRKAP